MRTPWTRRVQRSRHCNIPELRASKNATVFVTKRQEDSYSFYDFDNQDEVLGMLRLARGAENVKHYLITPDTTLEEQLTYFSTRQNSCVPGWQRRLFVLFPRERFTLDHLAFFHRARNVSQCERMLMSLNASTTICVFVFSNVQPTRAPSSSSATGLWRSLVPINA